MVVFSPPDTFFKSSSYKTAFSFYITLAKNPVAMICVTLAKIFFKVLGHLAKFQFLIALR